MSRGVENRVRDKGLGRIEGAPEGADVVGLLGIDGRRKPFLLVLRCWWIDPDRFGERHRHGRFVDEALWVFRISCRKDLLAIRECLPGSQSDWGMPAGT